MGILQSPPSVRPSVRPSRYLLLNHWAKSNQIRCVCCSHEWGVKGHNFSWPRPLGPWGGGKRSNIVKFQLQSQFRIFLNQTLCVFPQMKDIKHIRRDFYSVAWVRPQRWDYRGLVSFFPKFNQKWCVSYSHELHMQRHNLFGPAPLGPLGGMKRSNINKLQLLSQFQIFLNQTLCVFSQLKDTE